MRGFLAFGAALAVGLQAPPAMAFDQDSNAAAAVETDAEAADAAEAVAEERMFDGTAADVAAVAEERTLDSTAEAAGAMEAMDGAATPSVPIYADPLRRGAGSLPPAVCPSNLGCVVVLGSAARNIAYFHRVRRRTFDANSRASAAASDFDPRQGMDWMRRFRDFGPFQIPPEGYVDTESEYDAEFYYFPVCSGIPNWVWRAEARRPRNLRKMIILTCPG